MLDVDAYLRRLGGLERRPPSVEALAELHRAHASRVPYECLTIWLGEPTTVDPLESAGRILRGRGGYCFHLNGAFSLLLTMLGYRVTRHVGGVQPNAEMPAGATGNHLVLTVSGLPAPEVPDGRWLVDLGMGDGIYEPLPLTPGEYRQGPFRYALRPSDAEPGGWRFDHDPGGGFLGMDFRSEPAAIAGFAARHEILCTSPESGFVRTLTAQRRDATGADVLRGLRLSRIGSAATKTLLDNPADYFTALSDVFGLTLSPTQRDHLWPRLVTAHEQWLAAQ